MDREECPASILGLHGQRDILVWRCGHPGCGRYFYGTVGYRYNVQTAYSKGRTPQCTREGAFLVAQRALGLYVCPVAGCSGTEQWQESKLRLAAVSNK